MKQLREANDEEYKAIRRLFRIVFLRMAIIWLLGILFLVYKIKG